MDFLTEAADLVRFGFKVFPIGHNAKVPAHKGGRGCLDATDDEEVIGEWSHAYQNANIGIACGESSGIIVIDFDPRNGSDATVKMLASRKQFFPPTIEVRTWSGGTHLYYRWLPEIRNSKSMLGRGIDVKTTGGYVVAPPSRVRQDGKSGQYVWVRSPLGGELPRLPRWAVEALKPKPAPVFVSQKVNYSGDLGGVIKYIENAPQGQRNNILHWGACRAAESGACDATTRSLLLSVAVNIGLNKAEAEKTIASGFKKAGRV